MIAQSLFGDCIEIMKRMDSCSIDACVTDPPYFIGMHGKKWDKAGPTPLDIQKSHVAWVRELFRVLKPGAHVLAFSATKTVHRMTNAFEDEGFEIRDQLGWVHPQGVSKSTDISKALERHFFEQWLENTSIICATLGDRRQLISDYIQGRGLGDVFKNCYGEPPWGCPSLDSKGNVVPAHPEAIKHYGEGTLLRPVWEPIVFARKPIEGTLAENVIEFGTGSLQLDGCRGEGGYVINRFTQGAKPFGLAKGQAYESFVSSGRLPTNLMVDDTGEFDRDFAIIEGSPPSSSYELNGYLAGYTHIFVIPKASGKEKNAGLDEPNPHGTVKPVSLMRHLIKMITPKGGVCLDPFMGSGSTGVACVKENVKFIGCEKEKEYFEVSQKRLDHVLREFDNSFGSMASKLEGM